ncbi:MAG: AraC family transcriptional regulator [Lentisphaerales bacterium]|nr:AraC family transcriptional regulator [Lentisphaerales bacterium]
MDKAKSEMVDNFFEQAEPFTARLFEYLSDVYFFIKDREGRFMKVNGNFLKLFGYKKEEEVVGLTDFDMVSRELAIKYENDDKKILETGVPLCEQKEPVSSAQGIVSVYVTTKLPIYNSEEEIIGLVGITRDIAKTQTTIRPIQELQKAVENIEKNYSKDIKIDDLASLCNMSTSTFLRRFKKHFHMPPVQYIKKVRLNAVCRMLLENDRQLCDISYECGFCDQSYMTREFRKLTGLSPSEYRKKYY